MFCPQACAYVQATRNVSLSPRTYCSLSWRPIWFRNFRWTFWFPQIKTKCDTFSYFKIYQNAVSAGAPPRTLPRKLTTLPRPPIWIWRLFLGGERKQRIRKGRGENIKGVQGRTGDWPRRVVSEMWFPRSFGNTVTSRHRQSHWVAWIL